MKKPRVLQMICTVFAFCAATAIASPAQVLTTLHSFAGYPTDGATPYAALVQGADGNFYGTTYLGGTQNNQGGTVFRITPSGTLTTLYSFVGLPYGGSKPVAGLVQATDGDLYGTTEYGGYGYNYGTVFKITPSGTLTTLYDFSNQGVYPMGTLVQASDGNFYGTTAGLAFGYGTVFNITPDGTLTTLYFFCSQPNCADGAYSVAGLVQGTDGNFYGTTELGGNRFCGGCGTVFKITPSGALTTLYDFGSDGVEPATGLVQATDGNFYGTTQSTIFKITPSGTLTTLGGAPYASQLIQATDGNFYGTTQYGGTYGQGTVFKITSGGNPDYAVQLLLQS